MTSRTSDVDAKDYIEAASAVGGMLSGLAAILTILKRNAEHIPVETWEKMEDMEQQLRELLKEQDAHAKRRGPTHVHRPADT